MSTPAIANFTSSDPVLQAAYQGSPFTAQFDYQTNEGVGISIAGYTVIAMEVWDAQGDKIHTASLANGQITVLDASIGRFLVNIPQSVIATLPPGVGRYRVYLRDGAGMEWTCVRGDFEVQRV